MDRERRAVVAFAVMAALVTTPIALTRASGSNGHQAAGAVGSHDRDDATGRSRPPGPNRTAELERVVRHLRSRQAAHPGPEADGPVLRLPAGCGPAAPPVFSGARPAGSAGNERAILREMNRLGRTARLTDLATFTMGRSGWLADSQTGLDVFSWYDRWMRPVQFWHMGRALRFLIGVRPAGEVDSPPLLYVNKRAAVLVRQIGRDRMGLLVAAACSGAEAV